MHKQKYLSLLFSQLNSLIESENFQKKHKLKSTFFTRKRKLGFADIILFISRLPQKTLSTEMSDFVTDVLSKKQIRCVSKQAFSEARQKISHLAFSEILHFTYQFLSIFPAPHSNWNGYIVKAIDGTSFRVPDTLENKEFFQTQKNQYKEIPLIKASALYNVTEDLIENVILGKCRDSEKAQAIELLSWEVFHNESTFPTVVTFDRGYPSGELIKHIIKNEGLFLMRCSTATFKQVLNCKKDDSIITITSKKSQIKLRVIRFFLESNIEEILITNIFDNSLTVENFKELYFLRWKIEVKYKEIKQQLKVENFSGTKPIAILQDIYATLTFANIASALKDIVDKIIEKDTKKKENKYEYQANRNYILGELKKNLHLLLHNSKKVCKDAISELLFLAAKSRSPIRDERKNERICRLYQKSLIYRTNQRTSM